MDDNELLIGKLFIAREFKDSLKELNGDYSELLRRGIKDPSFNFFSTLLHDIYEVNYLKNENDNITFPFILYKKSHLNENFLNDFSYNEKLYSFGSDFLYVGNDEINYQINLKNEQVYLKKEDNIYNVNNDYKNLIDQLIKLNETRNVNIEKINDDFFLQTIHSDLINLNDGIKESLDFYLFIRKIFKNKASKEDMGIFIERYKTYTDIFYLLIPILHQQNESLAINFYKECIDCDLILNTKDVLKICDRLLKIKRVEEISFSIRKKELINEVRNNKFFDSINLAYRLNKNLNKENKKPNKTSKI